MQFRDLLKANSEGLRKLTQRAEILSKTEHQLKAFLPHPLDQHTGVANIREQTLVLHAESAAWCTRVRYFSPQILDHMKSQPGLNNLSSVTVRVSRPQHSAIDSDPQPTKLSPQSKELLHELAGSLEDGKLKQTLLQLAGTTE